MASRAFNLAKNASTDRILVLTKLDPDKNTLSGTGLIDNQLFTGGNELHAIMDTRTSLWYLKYKSGILPEPLRQKFTGFTGLMKFVTEYFKRRNIKIERVID